MKALVTVLLLAGCSFADKHQCVVSDDCDAGRVCLDSVCIAADSVCTTADCALYAIEPKLAAPGGTLTLEGTFGPDLTVQFPGGVSAKPSTVDVHRATVAVPDTATAGDLYATTSGKRLGPIAFRRARFAPSIGPTLARPDQTAYARRPPQVGQRSDVCAVDTGTFVYLIGDKIERARVEADGALSSFSDGEIATLSPRAGAACVVAGQTLYLLGPDNSVETSTIVDGQLRPFTAAGTMTKARRGATAAVAGDTLYVFGPDQTAEQTVIGSQTFAAAQPMRAAHEGAAAVVANDTLYIVGETIERATISDGTLGTFQTMGNLGTPRTHFGIARLANHFYVLGGEDLDGKPLDTVENIDLDTGIASLQPGLVAPRTRAGSAVIGNFVHLIAGNLDGEDRLAIDQDAIIGPFAPSVALDQGRAQTSIVTLGSWLYLIGGRNDTNVLQAIVRARVGTDGSIGTFQPAGNLSQPRYLATLAVVDDTLWVIGGTAGGTLSTIERSPIAANGDLGPFTVADVVLNHPRFFASTLVIDDAVWVFGGRDNNQNVSTVEKAIIGDGDIGPFVPVSAAFVVAPRGATAISTPPFAYFAGGTGNTGASITDVAAFHNGAFSEIGPLDEARGGPGSFVVGGNWYVLGGMRSVSLWTIDFAPIRSDGSLGEFTYFGPLLSSTRNAFSAIVVGDWAYAVGGFHDNVALDTTDRASVGK